MLEDKTTTASTPSAPEDRPITYNGVEVPIAKPSTYVEINGVPFEVEEEAIGSGGFADVYHAYAMTQDESGNWVKGQEVAIKVLKEVEGDALQLLGNEFAEMLAAAELNPGMVVEAFAFIDHKINDIINNYCIVMEYIDPQKMVDGREFIHRIRQQGTIAGALKACSQLGQIMDAQIQQRGKIAIDVKPENYFVSDEYDTKMTDFGVMGEAGKSNSNKMGSPKYMAPEQWRHEPLTNQTAVYQLALNMYELFMGQQYFDMENPLLVSLACLLNTDAIPTDSNGNFEEETPREKTKREQLSMNPEKEMFLFMVLSRKLARQGIDSKQADDIANNMIEVLKYAMKKTPTDRYATCQDFVDAMITAAHPDNTKILTPADFAATEVASAEQQAA